MINTNIAAEDPTLITSEGSGTIAVNFIGIPTGFGNRQEESLGIPSPITQMIIGPDSDGSGGRLKTIFPISVDEALKLPPTEK